MKQETPDFNRCLKTFKALADARRLRAAALLAYAGRELCVCELVDALGESQYNVSRAVGALCAAGIIRKEKKGRWAMYTLAEESSPLAAYIKGLVKPAPCCAPVANDIVRLKKRLALRQEGVCVIGCNCWKY
ncbi:MAG TPA: ArsR family transcriptional regulator [Elusimicrobia bacterium]|nr:MAG: hypothetical protein A2016_02605 [Elusimicrobia bacterium GWF2_62_30]HBA61642.1 ArsR family transcriptional regulator [Elusimicrobiota bacterium]